MKKVEATKVMEFGKITIPARLREKYHIRKADYMLFWDTPNGTICMKLVLPIDRKPARMNPKRRKRNWIVKKL